MKKWFERNKDKIFIWVCVGLIAIIVLLVVLFQRNDVDNIKENNKANISILEDENNLNFNYHFENDILVSDNLIPNSSYSSNVMSNGYVAVVLSSSSTIFSNVSLSSGTYTLSILFNSEISVSFSHTYLLRYRLGNSYYTIDTLNIDNSNVGTPIILTFTIDNASSISFVNTSYSGYQFCYARFMLNSGSHALPYEPYGSYVSQTLYNDYVENHSYTNTEYNNYGTTNYNNGYNSGYSDGLNATPTPVFSSLWSDASYEYGSTRGDEPYVSDSLSDIVITTNTLDFREIFTYISGEYDSSWLDYGNSFEAYFKIIFDDSNSIFLNEILSCNFVSNRSLSTYYVNVTLNTNQIISFSFNYNNGWFLSTNETISKDMIMRSIEIVGGQPYDSSSVYDDAILYFNYDLYGSAFSSGFNEGSSNSQSTINTLSDEVNSLNNTISDLNDEVNSLNNSYQILSTNYNSLEINYNNLLSQYNALANGSYTFSELFWSISAVPMGVLTSAFNVNVLGVNLRGIITGLFTALLLIWLFKKLF